MYRVTVLSIVFYGLTLFVSAQNPAPASPSTTPPKLKDLNAPNTSTPPVLQNGNAPSTSGTPNPKTGEGEVIKITTDLVTTPVSVLDRQGRFIPNLKKKDFQIFDNGVAQEITYFQSSEQPFTVVLMLDLSPSTKYKMDEIHFAAMTFVNQLRATDKVMVVAFDSRIHVLTEQPTSNKQEIFAAIYKSNFGSGTSIYEAVRFITELDMIKVTGRKAVVIFTDGVDTTSRQASFESTIAGVQEVDALFYPIHYNTMDDTSSVVRTITGSQTSLPPDIQAMLAQRGIVIDPRAVRGISGTTQGQYMKGQTYLTKLAENTGGRIYEAADIQNLDDSFKNIAEELRRQYSIGYYPVAEGVPGERRTMKVKVTRPPGAIVRSKSTYVIRTPRPDTGAASGATGR